MFVCERYVKDFLLAWCVCIHLVEEALGKSHSSQPANMVSQPITDLRLLIDIRLGQL